MRARRVTGVIPRVRRGGRVLLLSMGCLLWTLVTAGCAGATRGVSVALPLGGPVLAKADTSQDDGLLVLWNERTSGRDFQTKAWMATNERELASLWNEVGIVEPIPCVDFRKYVVFGVAGKGGVCPDEITTAVASSGGVLKLGAEVSTSACVLVAVRAAQVVAVPRRLLGRRVVFVPFDPIETSAFAFDMTPRASDASPGEDARLADTDALGDPPPKGEVTLPAPGHLALRSFEDGTEVWIVHERSERIFAVGATFTAAPLRVPVRWNAKAGRFDPGFDWHGRSVHGEREPDITRYRVERVDPMHVRLVGRLGPPRAAAGLPEDPPTLDGPSEPYTELATSGDFASIPDGTVARLAADLVFGPVGPGRICVPPADRKLAARFAACPEEAPALDGSDGKRGGRVIVQGPLIVRRHGAGAS